jgi:hypothetical protein
LKLWASIKKWFLECWEATADGSIATSMWVDGYSDFEIEEELRNHEKRLHQRSDTESVGVCKSEVSPSDTDQ